MMKFPFFFAFFFTFP
ncbi:MAG: hypothetical protein ABN478_11570 [Mixta sp.]|nr:MULTISPECIES: hypothetical protein [Mixta]